MKLIDLRAVGAAYRFVLDNPTPVLAAAGLYGVVFSVQSLLTAYAHAYAPGAAPGMILFMIAAFGAFVVAGPAWGVRRWDCRKKAFTV